MTPRLWVSESSFTSHSRNITGHFGDKSFQAIACTGIDNSKQTGENTPETQNNDKINKLALGEKNT